jgi:LuxR family maltose regulon positive regulatory protein
MEPSAPNFILVLDDYHLILSPQIHEGMSFLLEHQPPNLRLVISTRADPPLPVFRLRARGQLTELRSDELRFTTEEAATFLNQVMNLDLTSADVEALEARTEGWIVGLQLAALALQGTSSLQSGEGAQEFIARFSGSHHYVLEYLTGEVVHRQPDPVKRFLLETSILERLCAPLCDAVTDRPGSGQMLADLQRRNLFIVPLDRERRWLRYHQLFADLLANLLHRDLPADHVRELHRRASAWHEQQGSLDDAIHHALQAEDFERAAALIEAAAQALLAHGRLTTLLRWLEMLPEGSVRARPRLRLYQGWALHLCGRGEEARGILHDTRKDLLTLPPSPERAALRGELAALLTGIATLHQDAATVRREAQEALAHLPLGGHVSRSRVLMALGTAYAYEDQLEQAVETWQQARDLALEAANPFLATAAIEMLAGLQIYHRGQLHEATQTLQQSLDLGITPQGTQLPFAGTAHALLADVYLEWNDLDAAAGLLDRAIELLKRGGIGYGRVHTYCARARLARALGQVEDAVQALQSAAEAVEAHTLWHLVMHLASCRVRFALWLGDVEAAAQWAQDPQAILNCEPAGQLPEHLYEVQQISRARVHLTRGDATAALATLDGLEEQAQSAGRRAQAIEISLLTALAWQAQASSAEALESLERSLSWAEPEGYVRLFLEAGPDLIPLLRQAAARGIQPTYANRLLADFGADQQEALPVPLLPGTPSLVEPLTPRELEVLALVCDGLSNKEIAEQLTVALNTVKKHTSHIYGKLGVTSRAQAMVQARDLGLC